MKILETHIVPAIKEKIRLQEYAPTVFKTNPTRSGIKKAIKREEILVDGRVAKTSDWVTEHQKIELLQKEKKQTKLFELNLEVIFEDDHLAVINKPGGYPTSGNYFKTIENALPFNLSPSKDTDALPRPLPVHRLDNPTSGLLLVAKTRSSQLALNRSFEQKEILKTYLALVHGNTAANFSCFEDIEGKPSVSHVKKISSWKKEDRIFSLVEVTPETGRTHQIRIHLSGKGHPIVGDKEYGKPEIFLRAPGLFLAATGLRFTHPDTGKPLSFHLPQPGKFQKYLRNAVIVSP